MANAAVTLRRAGAVEKREMRRLTRRVRSLTCPVSALELRFEHGGLHLPRLGLWLDPRRPVPGPERVGVSHAHADHTAPHREVILTAPTARFLRARLGGDRVEHVLAFGETREFDGPEGAFRLRLLPAGHVLGSALTWVEAGGESLLYTGDFKLRPGRAAEHCAPCPADVLVMETTFGRPEFCFPPVEEVMAGVIRFCRETLAEGRTAVLLGYSLGKSQEVLTRLAGAGLPLVLHEQVYRLTEIYAEFGVALPAFERLEAGNGRGRVVICPPAASRVALEHQLGPLRCAVLTGWALDPRSRFQYGADAAFPLSDHADFPELLRLVEMVNPRQVLTLHGFAADFAAALRERGWDARALSEADQLHLPLGEIPDAPPSRLSIALPAATAKNLAASAAWAGTGREGGGVAFAEFARVCASIAATDSKLEKVAHLAEHLKALPPDSLARAVIWFSGRPFAAVENRILGVGWAALRRALCTVAGCDETTFHRVYLRLSDTGDTAAELRRGQNPVGPPLTDADVAALFAGLADASGAGERERLLQAAFTRAGPEELKYLVKILTGDLRIGLKEGLVEEALALAFEVSAEAIRRTHLLCGHLGEVATLARGRALDRASLAPFRPVKFMLASPEPSAEAVWTRVRAQAGGGGTAWVEDKYDGIRCQLHKVGGQVRLFSRDLKDITPTFPEIADAARGVVADVILDGEILAARGETALPFAELQQRLGRREGDLFLGGQIPVRFIAFDLLWCNGQMLLDAPLRERRARLEALAPWPETLGLARVAIVASPRALEAAFLAARGRRHEGLVIKDPASPYLPGRRGLAWLKLKKAFATLDCVVVGAEYGHGKRRAVLSDYTFAVRDERSGEFLTIGKAYSGLTDAEIARLTAHFLRCTLRRRGRYHEVQPEVVLEIAFDRIQPSTRHSSGLALRFPRILRIREDKTPAEIDTLATARRLAGFEDDR